MEKEGDRSDRLVVSAEVATKHRAAVPGPGSTGFGSGGSGARQNHGNSKRG